MNKKGVLMRKELLRKTVIFLLIAVLAFSFTACGDNTVEEEKVVQDESLQRVLDAGKLVVGADTGFLSMVFEDTDGVIKGFDVDFATSVCERLGIDLEIVKIKWEEKEQKLYSGEIDCVWSAFSITPEREEIFNFTEPYLQNELIFLVSEESEAIDPSDLVGQSVGVQIGTTGYDALKNSYLSGIVFMETDSYMNLLDKLSRGKIDSVLIDSTFAFYFINNNTDKNFYVLSESLDGEEYGIGFRKEDQTLRNKIQSIMEEMAKDGSLSEISKKWFGSDITVVH